MHYLCELFIYSYIPSRERDAVVIGDFQTSGESMMEIY